MNRSTWHARTSTVVLAWLAAAAIVALAHRQVPASTWLMVHLLMLGAVTNALVIWSWHFTVAVLRAPPAKSRRGEVLRLVAVNAGALAVVAGVLL
ncbi:MAG: copper oxidase, partial [Candidatus Nanopelagicales bacterium]